ncbi:hypothetical protein M9H77_22016 [Catharanthus roseus]|uniref:Uncharacterized protein n=1 Tax=Catharanthus roseus TaxID=4058 RepID=A0ACC0ATB9_CATRO|nr:hypothetical protein M9H77_22016 [Catharanthus roseus]
MVTSENWQLFIHYRRHNHAISVYHHGHAQSHMSPRNTLRFFLEQNVDCAMRYNMPLLEAIEMTPIGKNFTVATTFMRNERHLVKGVLSLVLPSDGTSHIGSMYPLLIERYRSKVDLVWGSDQDLVWDLVRDPVGEANCHEPLAVEMDRTGGMIVISHLIKHPHFIAVSETLFSQIIFKFKIYNIMKINIIFLLCSTAAHVR